MDGGGGSTEELPNGHGYKRNELDFLSFSDGQLDIDGGNGSATAHFEGRNNEVDLNANSGTNAEQFTVDEVFERELVAFLTQAAQSTRYQPSTDSGPVATSLEAISLDLVVPEAHGHHVATDEPAHSHEQYLSGLAAVLHAAQAIQGGEASVEGVNVVNGGSTTMAPSNDLSDLLVHLTAQLEQGQQQSLPQPHVPSQTEVEAGPSSTSVPAESFNFFSPCQYAPLSTTFPGPTSGQVPYYSGVFATSFQQSQFQTPGAGSSTPDSQNDAGPKASSSKGKGKRKQADEGSRKSYRCEQCEKSFGRRSDMLRHTRIHTGDRPFVCPHGGCGKTFIQRSALHVHLRVHSGEKPHMCEYPLCGRTFSDSSSLARHRRTHTGKRPYACKWQGCAKMFTRRTALTQHMRTHDPNWEPDPNVRYSFRPKRRKTDGDEGDEDEDDDDEDEEEDNVIDPALEESVLALSTILSQAQPNQAQSSSQQIVAPSHTTGHSAANPTGPGSVNDNPQLVAAISAEIAAAIAQAQAQIQAEMFNEDDDDDDEESDAEDHDEDVRGDSLGMNVSGIRNEQLAPPPPESTTFLPPFSAPTPASSSSMSFPGPGARATESASSLFAPAVPSTTSAGHNATTKDSVNNGEEEEDFPVPLRERKPKPLKPNNKTTSTRTSSVHMHMGAAGGSNKRRR